MEAKQTIDKSNDPAVIRFLAWVDQHGGAAAIAKAIGKRPQFIYNIRDGRNRMGSETLQEIASAFPDFDANWILIGESRMPGAVPVKWPDITRQTPASGEDSGLIRERIAEVRERNEALEIRNDRLTARNEYLVDQLLKRSGIDPADFLQAVSETPAPAARLVVEGFQIRHQTPRRFRPDVRDEAGVPARSPLYTPGPLG